MTKILTLKEVAEILRIHPTTAYRMLKAGDLPCFKVGSDYRFKLSDIEKLIQGEGKSDEGLSDH